MPAKNGKEFIARIDAAKPDIWLGGEKISGPLSKHPAFCGVLQTQAEMYDLQHDPQLSDEMTYASPQDGQKVGLSFLPPTSKEDLRRRRRMFEHWNGRHHGLLGRSPDYKNTGLMALATAAEVLDGETRPFGKHLRDYYAYCRDHDISLSHAFVQPLASRYDDLGDDGTIISNAAQIVEETEEGIVVRGAFLLATQGVTTDELLVYPPANMYLPEENNPHTFAFAVPVNLPGIRWICRESLVGGSSVYDYPLSARFEEMDTLVIFDHVLVPWERVFVAYSDRLSASLFSEGAFHIHCAHQVATRYVAKTEFALGVILYMSELLERTQLVTVVEKTTEVFAQLETLRALLLASEEEAKPNRFGIMVPDRKKLWTANLLYPKIYPRLMEIIQLVGGSNVIMIPSERDFNSKIRGDLDKYLRGTTEKSLEKTALFRLAWELSSSSFGGRQTLYERFFFGDETVVRSRLYYAYDDKEKYIAQVKDFLHRKG